MLDTFFFAVILGGKNQRYHVCSASTSAGVCVVINASCTRKICYDTIFVTTYIFT